MLRHSCHAQMLAAHMQVHTFDNQMHAPATQVRAFDSCVTMSNDVWQYIDMYVVAINHDIGLV